METVPLAGQYTHANSGQRLFNNKSLNSLSNTIDFNSQGQLHVSVTIDNHQDVSIYKKVCNTYEVVILFSLIAE